MQYVSTFHGIEQKCKNYGDGVDIKTNCMDVNMAAEKNQEKQTERITYEWRSNK